ncbi:MAG: glycoside hydrolase family 3 N-terminal domain-containing protein, partial [Phycisphaerae bacterium]
MLTLQDRRSLLAVLGGALVVALLGCSGPVTSSDTEAPFEPKFAFQDPTLPLEERVDDLVDRMTLEEKVSQMQQNAPAIKRLDIPAYHWWSEALHGVARNGVATVFPQAIGLAATWNPELHNHAAHVIGVEARAKHHEAARHNRREIYTGLDMWSPNINIFRDPRWGRGQETYGEDPYLTGRMGVAFVQGLQGNDPDYIQIVATPKHFAVHSGPEQDRHRFDAQISQIDLWTTYLPAFEACIREGHAYSIMGAYNRTLGTPCCASPWLLTDILRTKWGFDGYVVSDVDAVADIHFSHQTTDTGAEAAALAVKAGCDLNGGSTYAKLTSAVHLGLIRESEIDISLKRLMRARMKLGMFDPPEFVTYAQTPYEINGSRAHDQLAREVARQSMVLLKNDAQALPLRKDLSAIAVIGPNADSGAALVGDYDGTPARPVSLLQG